MRKNKKRHGCVILKLATVFRVCRHCSRDRWSRFVVKIQMCHANLGIMRRFWAYSALAQRLRRSNSQRRNVFLLKSTRRCKPTNGQALMRGTEAVKCRGGSLVCCARTVRALLGQKPGQGTQSSQYSRTIRVTHLTTIFIIRAITHIVIAVFYAPLSPGNFQQTLSIASRIR